MKFKTVFGTATSLALAGMLAACGGVKLQRVPPGQSIRTHLSRTNETSEALPAPQPGDLPVAAGAGPGTANPNFAGLPQAGGVHPGSHPVEALPPLPVVGLPERNDSVERAGDAYNRGNLLMKSGQDREAVAAFEEATLLDPSFSDAWTRLTMLYEKIGQPDKAREAFRRAKGLSAQPERMSTPPPELVPPVALQPALPPVEEPLPEPKN